jgi:hypothetical protein
MVASFLLINNYKSKKNSVLVKEAVLFLNPLSHVLAVCHLLGWFCVAPLLAHGLGLAHSKVHMPHRFRGVWGVTVA